jgi:hypothetical protein
MQMYVRHFYHKAREQCLNLESQTASEIVRALDALEILKASEDRVSLSSFKDPDIRSLQAVA